MQLTTILYLKIPVYDDDILQIYQDFWTNFKLSKANKEYIFFFSSSPFKNISSSQKVKYLKYLIKLFTSGM
jgi:hypothetical protein